MKTLAQARAYFQHNLETSERNLAEFQKKLDRDPAYALEWSQAAFTDAARVRLCKAVLVDLSDCEDELIVERIQSHLTQQALNEARRPARSSSVTGNLMAQEWASVCAEAAAYLDGM